MRKSVFPTLNIVNLNSTLAVKLTSKLILSFSFLFFSFYILPSFAESIRQQPVKIALNWKPEPQFGGFYAAQMSSAQTSQLIELIPGGSGTPTIQMLAAGKVDYAVVSADEVILSHDRGGKDVVALFATYQTNPQMIMVRADQGYKSLKDMFQDPKATLLWQRGLPYAQYLAKKLGPIKAKEAPFSGGIGAFQAGPNIAQQGFVTSEPLLAKAAGLNVQTFLVADEGYNPYTTVLVTQKSRFQKNPEQVKMIVKLVRDGWNQYLTDPTAVHQLLQKQNSAMTPESLKSLAQAQISLIKNSSGQKTPGPTGPLGQMTKDRWQTLVDQLSDLKLIKAKPVVTDLFLDL